MSVINAFASQDITFTDLPVDATVGGSHTVTATGGPSGEPVTLSIAPATTNGACAISGSTVRFAHPGACVVNGDQAGNSDYAQAATGSQTIAVSPAASATTLAVTGTRVTAHVAVTAPGSGTATGTVAFSVAGKTRGYRSGDERGRDPDLLGVERGDPAGGRGLQRQHRFHGLLGVNVA